MKIPFTAEQFFEVFKNYNLVVFPLQILLIILALFAFYQAFRPDPISDRIISGILTFFWLWMGVVYHLIYFSTINKAAYIFGFLFLIQSILFFKTGILQKKLVFRFHKDVFGIASIGLILYSLVIYPVLGFYFNHVYPTSPTFGLPCPTTIFTFGMLLLIEKKFPLIIMIIPMFWSVTGFIAALKFGMLEDTGLILAGFLSFIMLIVKNRIILRKLGHERFAH